MKKSKIAIISALILCTFIPLILRNGKNIDETALSTNHKTGESYASENISANAATVDENSIISRAAQQPKRFFRDSKSIDYSVLEFTPWDIKKASAKVPLRNQKPYTIMIYMNGSDLESENGAATEDLIEMLESGVDSGNVNIVLFTGGTNRWQNNVIPENECAVWEIADGEIYKITGIGMANMGDPGTLSSFIDFSVANFPAKRYGLILWDHGGGSIAGYGHDEKFNESRLSLLDMNYAFEESVLTGKKIEFLGFDSCLMASVEMAVIASDYFKYMIASEELEPGAGWDYSFLRVINENPDIDGAALGKAITNYFMKYYGSDYYEDLTMSVIDLSKAGVVMEAMGDLMNLCSESLLADREALFKTLAKKRGTTKTFGVGSPRDNESDMVDIGNMVQKLGDLFPDEAARVLNSLDSAVVYTRHNTGTDLKGLSAYYVYGGRETAKESLGVYETLDMDEYYTGYLHNFYSQLSGGKCSYGGDSAVQKSGNDKNTRTKSNSNKTEKTSEAENSSQSNSTEFNEILTNNTDIIRTDLAIWKPVESEPGLYQMIGIKEDVDAQDNTIAADYIKNSLWPTINGQNVCLYKISESDNRTLYAVPVRVNERDCDIIILINSQYPDGKILGTRQEDGFIIQKGYDPINEGDEVSFYYQTTDKQFTDSNHPTKWKKSKSFFTSKFINLEWTQLFTSKSKMYYNLLQTDYQNNIKYTKIISFNDITSTF